MQEDSFHFLQSQQSAYSSQSLTRTFFVQILSLFSFHDTYLFFLAYLPSFSSIYSFLLRAFALKSQQFCDRASPIQFLYKQQVS